MEADEKICPFCAETVKAAAVKCKHCGSDLTEGAAAKSPLLDPPKKKGSGCLWIVIVVALAVIAFLGFGMYVNSTPEGKRRAEARNAYEYCQQQLDQHIGSAGEKRIMQGACNQLKDRIDNPPR
ncbi:hypothetical protein [Pseudomonas sp. GM_Psu_2]|uniref:hypothetical protein n=1 Tax=unclassified Pseudomonas TaxID=196821 RepID=UPI002269D157|nr:hypothetical protein [Pseudomonas sp. GM_Psu_2]